MDINISIPFFSSIQNLVTIHISIEISNIVHLLEILKSELIYYLIVVNNLHTNRQIYVYTHTYIYIYCLFLFSRK